MLEKCHYCDTKAPWTVEWTSHPACLACIVEAHIDLAEGHIPLGFEHCASFFDKLARSTFMRDRVNAYAERAQFALLAEMFSRSSAVLGDKLQCVGTSLRSMRDVVLGQADASVPREAKVNRLSVGLMLMARVNSDIEACGVQLESTTREPPK